MNYELRDGAIYPIEHVNRATGTVLRCPGCGTIILKRIEGILTAGEGCALQCTDPRCCTTYQIINTVEGGTEVAS